MGATFFFWDEITHFDNEVFCDECLVECTGVCNNCGERVWHSDIHSDSAYTLCHECYEDNYTTCCRCQRTIPNDDANYFDEDSYDNPYCANCYGRYEDVIHNYNYKPYPIFFGEGIHYGVELEVDEGGQYTNNASEVLSTANEIDQHIYIKSDGSLEAGFEIVSHPMSLEYHQECMPWNEVLQKLRKMGYSSHNTKTCGYHVHVGRNCLGVDEEEQDDRIAKILFFMENHWDSLFKFSRRSAENIARWASRYGYSGEPHEILERVKNGSTLRYVCVNLQNYSTIEFRIFRGTLNPNTFLATLQMVDEICHTAICLSEDKIKELTWENFVKSINTVQKKELVLYLKEKHLYHDIGEVSI